MNYDINVAAAILGVVYTTSPRDQVSELFQKYLTDETAWKEFKTTISADALQKGKTHGYRALAHARRRTQTISPGTSRLRKKIFDVSPTTSTITDAQIELFTTIMDSYEYYIRYCDPNNYKKALKKYGGQGKGINGFFTLEKKVFSWGEKWHLIDSEGIRLSTCMSMDNYTPFIESGQKIYATGQMNLGLTMPKLGCVTLYVDNKKTRPLNKPAPTKEELQIQRDLQKQRKHDAAKNLMIDNVTFTAKRLKKASETEKPLIIESINKMISTLKSDYGVEMEFPIAA